MRVLSLFDGISCARVALERVGFNIETYYSSEVDKYAIQIAKSNYPNTIQLGDVRIINTPMLLTKHIDLLIGGSPCQDLSIAKKNRQGLSGARSGLFWEYVRILEEVKPKYFILENVASMPKEARQVITETLGVEPVMIDAALVSAQNRKRLFWTNIGKIDQPKDRGILLKNILEDGIVDRDKSYCIDAHYYKGTSWDHYKKKSKRQLVIESEPHIIQKSRGFNKGGIKALNGKTPTLSSHSWEQNNKLVKNFVTRKLTPIECERLQGLPDGYTQGVSNTQRYKALGNAFNVDVVAHILSYIKTATLQAV